MLCEKCKQKIGYEFLNIEGIWQDALSSHDTTDLINYDEENGNSNLWYKIKNNKLYFYRKINEWR